MVWILPEIQSSFFVLPREANTRLNLVVCMIILGDNKVVHIGTTKLYRTEF